jgi:hypothetical protein
MGNMSTGVAATFSAATDKITLLAHGLTTGVPVLYSGAPAISGLTTGTTYFVINIDADTIQLATTSAKAILGDPVGITGQLVGATAHTYTLAPLAISGTPSFKWSYSNDGETFLNASAAGVSMGTYIAGGTHTAYDFNDFNYGFLALDVIAPTQGGILIKAVLNAK